MPHVMAMRSLPSTLLLASMLSALPGVVFAQSAAEGERIFQEKCTSCHRIGGGKLVGPDLQGVASRREKSWIRRQIKDPIGMVLSGDPIATQLVKEMNGMQMAPLGLTDAQVESVVAFLERASQQNQAARGMPWQYVPTLSASAVAALALTGLALRAGRKRVDIR